MEFQGDLFVEFSEPSRAKNKSLPADKFEKKEKKDVSEKLERDVKEDKQKQENEKHEKHEKEKEKEQEKEKEKQQKPNKESYRQLIIKSEDDEKCRLETCYPPDWIIPNEPKPAEPSTVTSSGLVIYGKKAAKEYKFVLDPFQRRALECLERGESVLVSAHTSAGKTVVAEYAIAMALRDKQRVIYTSPIKALSNQKYRELEAEFSGDCGLMTGDVTVNPNSSCLVMTTEILRNMLYRGSELMREVAWVIFDEIHYMRDKERGVVWEETIIMLPDKVKFVFLSATIPNATEFALWIAKLHKQPCNVVYTDYRPTPLQHYVFPSCGDGLYLVVDEKGQFREDNFQKVLTVMNSTQLDDAIDDGDIKYDKKKKKRKGRFRDGPSDIYKIVQMIMDRHYQPVIIFSFSKRECEANALQLSKLDFCDESEKKLIEQIFNSALDSLSEDDKHLPQVENILPLLKRGIGIHHGGLLPILKEIIEILFQEQLIKALFSTETFSMGLNMPAKTVVFTNIRKFDGRDYRVVSSGEYIQMSGRAGRRGLDDRGIVILMLDEKMEPPVAKNMLRGEPDKLNSSFHLSYNMLLNLLRVEGADPEQMMSRSFYQFQRNLSVPNLEQKLEQLEKQKDSIMLEDPKAISEYHHLKQQIESFTQKKRDIENQPVNAVSFLNPGRLARVKDGDADFGWGVVVNFQKKTVPKSGKPPSIDGSDATYIVDMLLNCDPETVSDKPISVPLSSSTSSLHNRPKPAPPGTKGSMEVIPVMLSCLNGFSTIRLYVKQNLRTRESRESTGKQLAEVIKRFYDGIPFLDPIQDIRIQDPDYLKSVRKIETLEDTLLKHPLHNAPNLKEQYEMYMQKLDLESQISNLQLEIKNTTQDYGMKQTLKNMKRVLLRLGHVKADNVIDTKGRVACEISTCDELLATELMFSGMFNPLPPEKLVALVSCLVFNEKCEEKVKLRDDMHALFRQLQDAARRIATVIQDARIPIDVEEYLGRFQPHMIEIVHSWCKGAKFSEICKMTDIFEGTIIRCMRRLEELLRQLSLAAKSIGNTELEQKFDTGIEKLKRDIVFAASLYL